jgi:tetratricopeptide (TPR) repeat protein
MELYEDPANRSSDARELEGAARVRLNLAITLGRTGEFDRAHTLLDDLDRQLASPESRLAPLPPAKRQLLRVDVDDHRGMVFANAGDTEAAVRAFEQALRLADEPLADGQADAELGTVRVGVLERLGLITQQRREWERAAPWLDRACAEYERLLADEPEVLAWQTRLARVLGARATNQRMLGDVAAAGADHDRCVEVLSNAVRVAPTDLACRRTLAVSLAERADHRSQCGDTDGARNDYELCERVFEQAIAIAPGDVQTRANHVAALANHAGSLASRGDYAAAREINQRAIDLARELAGPVARSSLIQLLAQGGDYAQRDADLDMGLICMEEAATMAQQFLQERPDDVTRQFLAATVALNHGTLNLSLHQHAEAIRIWEAALPVCRAGAAAASHGRTMLRLVLLRLADVHTRDGDRDQARRWFQCALEETQATSAMVAGYPPLPDLFEDADLHDLLPPGHPDK